MTGSLQMSAKGLKSELTPVKITTTTHETFQGIVRLVMIITVAHGLVTLLRCK